MDLKAILAKIGEAPILKKLLDLVTSLLFLSFFLVHWVFLAALRLSLVGAI